MKRTPVLAAPPNPSPAAGGYSFDSGLPLCSEQSPPPAAALPSGRCRRMYAALDERASGGGAVTASRRALSRHKEGALLQTMDAVLSPRSVWDVVKAYYNHTVGAYISAEVHLSRLLESCGLASLTHQTDWVRLFERHPEFEVVDVDTSAVLYQALSDLRRHFEAPYRSARLALLFFTSYGGSGKSRTCGKLATLVSRVRRGDVDAAAALDSVGANPLAHSSATLSAWVQTLRIVGINFNSSRWGLGAEDRGLMSYGVFIPLYLRMLFFEMADLTEESSSEQWQQLCKRCKTLLAAGFINEVTLANGVSNMLLDLAGRRTPFQPVIVLVDELQKVTDFFLEPANVGDAFRSEICRLANTVGGHAVFSSVSSSLMTREGGPSRRPVQELLRLPRIPVVTILQEALRQNAERGVYLSFNGTVATWSFVGLAPPGAAGLVSRGLAALACLVGDNVRFATFLALHMTGAKVQTGAVWDVIASAATRVGLPGVDLWTQPYGPSVLAHVLLGTPVWSESQVLDAAGRDLGSTWGTLQLRGHVQSIGGERFVPELPLFVSWSLSGVPAELEHIFIFRSIGKMLQWRSSVVWWCGWELFYPCCLMALDNARVLVYGDYLTTSLVALFPTSSFIGRGLLLTADEIEAAQPRHNLQITTLQRLMDGFIAGDGRLVNHVWQLNQGAPAIDAAVVYTTASREQVLLCVQHKFSSAEAGTSTTWSLCSDWVKAMRDRCAQAAGEAWPCVTQRVAFLVVARRARGADLPREQGENTPWMDNALVLCWEDLEAHLGRFLFGLANHADTLFEA